MPTVVKPTAANVALELEGKFGAFVDKVSLPVLLFPAADQPTFGAFEARINVSSASALLDWAMTLARRKVADASGACRGERSSEVSDVYRPGSGPLRWHRVEIGTSHPRTVRP